MAVPEVADAKLTITAPFCAVVVEMVGVAVVFSPPPLFPAPRAHIKALDKRMTVSIVIAVRMVKLLFREGVKEPIQPLPN